jgi:EgtB-related family protein
LPTEFEWECAALSGPGFSWGHVWEWTASPFIPFPGFVPHPYRDYSKPWFDTRRVLKGACAATSAALAHPRYRNFFEPQRSDIFAGFRSCA